MSALWWNENESGWGITLTRQTDITFATIFTFDSNGQPTWYIASNCEVEASGCSGLLYQVTGGAAITVPWGDSDIAVKEVGDFDFQLITDDSGTLRFELNGLNSSKEITRQIWATSTN
ncbi:MAG: hypothetical protein VB957_11970 [Pseudomonadales bacterium]|jgi:hypothetical protein